MEFNLEKHTAKIAHINLREERHGDDPVLAVDIKVTADVPNDFLSYLRNDQQYRGVDSRD